MGFRFRKSFKIAPGVRLNLSRKSTGLSFGGKGFRYSVSSSGRRTTTVGIPGTGISYSTTSGNRKKSGNTVHPQRNDSSVPTPPVNPRPPIYKRKWFIILWLVLFPPLGIFLFLKFWPSSRKMRIPVVVASAIWFFFALVVGGNGIDPRTPAESSMLPESSVTSMIEESSEVAEEASQSIQTEKTSADESSVVEPSELETSALPPEESEVSSILEESSEDKALSEVIEPSSEFAAETNLLRHHIHNTCDGYSGNKKLPRIIGGVLFCSGLNGTNSLHNSVVYPGIYGLQSIH